MQPSNGSIDHFGQNKFEPNDTQLADSTSIGSDGLHSIGSPQMTHDERFRCIRNEQQAVWLSQSDQWFLEGMFDSFGKTEITSAKCERERAIARATDESETVRAEHRDGLVSRCTSRMARRTRVASNLPFGFLIYFLS